LSVSTTYVFRPTSFVDIDVLLVVDTFQRDTDEKNDAGRTTSWPPPSDAARSTYRFPEEKPRWREFADNG